MRSISRFYRTGLILLLCGVSACSEGGGDSPTEPSNSLLVTVGGIISNEQSGRPTILEIETSIDGKVMNTRQYSPAQGIAEIIAFGNIGRGRHTLAVRVKRQTSSPNRYELTGTISISSGSGASSSIAIQGVRKSLATGESITFPFDANL